MIPRRLVIAVFLILLSLTIPAMAIAQEGDVPARPWPVLKVADPRAGIVSSTQAQADNLPVWPNATQERAELSVATAQRFAIRADYEVVFFPRAAGAATFELEVWLMREGEALERWPDLGTDKVKISGIGAKRHAGYLLVGLHFPQPGVYTLLIKLRTTAAGALGSGSVVDEDELYVVVVVGDASIVPVATGTPKANPSPTPARPTPTSEPGPLHTRTPGTPDTPRGTPTASILGNEATTTESLGVVTEAVVPVPLPTIPEPSPAPIGRQLTVAFPRGHFLSPMVAGVENFPQHNQPLIVRQGSTATLQAAYEFVWFEQGVGQASTEMVAQMLAPNATLQSAMDEQRVSLNQVAAAQRTAGTLDLSIPFEQAGQFTLTVRVHTRLVLPATSAETVLEDIDLIPIRVIVLGGPSTGAISGTVTAANSGLPLQGVLVQAFAAESGRSAQHAYTAEDGSYLLAGLAPGKYLIHADAGEQNYLPEWYDDGATRQDATPVEVLANTVTGDIDMALTPGASISGHVVEDTGALTVYIPLPNVVVTVGRMDDRAAVAKTRTLADGTYRIDKLPAGRYWVHAGDNTRLLIDEYYDNRLRFEDADPVELEEGQQADNIHFALRYSGAIAGRVQTEEAFAARANAIKVRAYDWESGEAVRTVDVAPDGSYLLSPLPVGGYRVYAFDQAGRYAPEYYDDAALPENATRVVVERGSVTHGIDFQLASAGRAIVEIRPILSQVRADSSFEVAIHARDVRDLGAFQLELHFNAAVVQAVSVQAGHWLSSTGRSVIELPSVIDNQGGHVTLGAASTGSQPGPNGSGVLATVTFRALAGQCALELRQVQLHNTQAGMIPASAQSGRVVVGECMLGDFDCNCEVNIADVMQVARRWGARLGDPQYDARFDLDQDGDIDIVDLSIVASAWGKTCESAPPPGATAPINEAGAAQPLAIASGLRLTASESSVSVAQPVTVQVWIDDALDLAAFECVLQYDPARLAALAEQVSVGPFLGSTGRPVLPTGTQVMMQAGLASLRLGALTLGPSPAGPEGSGLLAELPFVPLLGGHAEISLASAQVADTVGQTQDALGLQSAFLQILASSPILLPLIQR